MKTKIFSAFVALCFFSMLQGATTAPVDTLDTGDFKEKEVEQILTEAQTSQVQSLKANLQIFQQHYDNMFRQNIFIEGLFQQFMRWSAVVQTEGWDPGYEIIIEDINAHPDPIQKESQLRTLAALVSSLRDDELSQSVQQEIQAALGRRKQDLMQVKKDLILIRLRDIAMAKAMANALCKKIEIQFFEGVKRLSSLGVVEGLCLTEPDVSGEAAERSEAGDSEPAAEELQSVVTLVYQWLEVQKQTKINEIAILEAKLTELKRKYARFQALELKVSRVLEDLRKQEKSRIFGDLIGKLSALYETLHVLIGEVRGIFDREHDRWIRLTPESNYWVLEE